jgi:hypothetical protein
MSLEWIVEKIIAMVGMLKGSRFYALKSGIRQGRVNMIAALM